nr:unnamed protein product [Digitaria exilis]
MRFADGRSEPRRGSAMGSGGGGDCGDGERDGDLRLLKTGSAALGGDSFLPPPAPLPASVGPTRRSSWP